MRFCFAYTIYVASQILINIFACMVYIELFSQLHRMKCSQFVFNWRHHQLVYMTRLEHRKWTEFCQQTALSLTFSKSIFTTTPLKQERNVNWKSYSALDNQHTRCNTRCKLKMYQHFSYPLWEYWFADNQQQLSRVSMGLSLRNKPINK